MLPAGNFNQRVEIQSRSVSRDVALGSEVISWATLATVWARVEDVREPRKGGDEAAAQDQRIVHGRAVVTVRFRTDVTTDMRIRWISRNRLLQITSKAEIGKREGLELSCEEFSV